MENEIMNNVDVIEDTVEVIYDDVPNGNMGLGVLIGAALTGVGIAAFKWGKKKWADHKAKKTEGVVKFKDDEDKTAEEEVTVE